ncbi:uncharacterized protein B0P05DRAFT_574322 [Gilbertella persicaria]|uniref:uncharacterized protein n=1 Tax=Gilbertella persicaria TaxID=101096 RepID=UPI00221ED18B|nr:uncharacterized protein B0P05DRAFT_574322 [Gilbertella persicaria]KAI8063394.1 hypothetical protein B0P05DRAFT_574322 [Gilbertella persicaria]
MNDIDSLFQEQQDLEDEIDLKFMLIQIGITLGFIITAISFFSCLRPRFPIIYSPKTALSKTDNRRPMPLGAGWFDWIKPVIKIKDNTLLETIGFDGFVFIYFTRTLRRLVIVITGFSMTVFLPINIIAAYNTDFGHWPPNPGLNFMSISAMNYEYGKKSHLANLHWYWSPTIATCIFTGIVLIEMIRSSETLIQCRNRYIARCQKTPLDPDQELMSRTLLVQCDTLISSQINTKKQQHLIVPHAAMKQCVDSIAPCQHALVGKYNPKLYDLIKEYNHIAQSLEKNLYDYLTQLSQDSHAKRPVVRLNWKLTADAIDHYTEKAVALDALIKRNRMRLQNCHYGWAIYPTRSAAYSAYRSLQKHNSIRVQFVPQPQDIIWSNMNIDPHQRQLKRWFGHGLFSSIVSIWAIPIAALAVCSNLINFIRLFPQSKKKIDDCQLAMGLFQSYFTPCLMVVFHVGLPRIMSYISRQQAYKTETMVERKTLGKLYLFFIVNNMIIFTLVNMMIGIAGQIAALMVLGSSQKYSDYLMQIAKNMTDVSTFWINYVCIRSAGALFDLLQLPSLYALLKKRKLESPPVFCFAKNYSLVLSFFTATLAFSVASPIVLPFGLLYFCLATTTFKYKMTYIYVTKTETGGLTWPLLYRIVILSLLVFQIIMILILSLMEGKDQLYGLIPLPFVTLVVGALYICRLYRKMDIKTWTCASQPIQDEVALLNTVYADPSLSQPLIKPSIPKHLEHLVQQVYRHHAQYDKIIKTLFTPPLPKSTAQKEPQEESEELIIIPTSPSSEQVNVLSSVDHYHEKTEKAIQPYPHEPSTSYHDPNVFYTPIEPSAPILEHIVPPPTYTDVVITPRINQIQTMPQQKRRHSA